MNQLVMLQSVAHQSARRAKFPRGFESLFAHHLPFSPTNLHLETLWLSMSKVSDLSPIKNFKNVEGLDFGYTKVNDVSALKDLKKLKMLTMWSTQVNDISAFKNLKNLEYLNISNDILDKGHVLDALKDINVRVMVPVPTDGRKPRFMYWKERKKYDESINILPSSTRSSQVNHQSR